MLAHATSGRTSSENTFPHVFLTLDWFGDRLLGWWESYICEANLKRIAFVAVRPFFRWPKTSSESLTSEFSSRLGIWRLWLPKLSSLARTVGSGAFLTSFTFFTGVFLPRCAPAPREKQVCIEKRKKREKKDINPYSSAASEQNFLQS